MLTNSQNMRGLFQVAGAWVPTLPSPESADRVMTCGFSYLQHIGAGARVNMWVPLAEQQSYSPSDIPAKLDWIAIRQVEVLHEGCHIELFDMEMEHFKRSLKFFNAARGRSQRLVVMIGGRYRNPRANQDHLARFDHRFRRRLQSMINMLWLDEMNAVTGRASGRSLPEEWNIGQLLPHIGATFGAMQLFQPKSLQTSPQGQHYALATQFLHVVQAMPRQAAREHSIFVGLKIPKFQDDNDIDWGPAPEFQRLPFIQALQAVFRPFGMAMASTHHPRGHGDHMHCRKRRSYTVTQEPRDAIA